MSTWLDDLKERSPALAADYAIVGNQSINSLRMMVKALKLMPALNTPDDNKRLAAAQRIIKAMGGK